MMTGMAGEAAKPGGKLTANQRRFVEEYAVDRNATQAYFRAFGRNKSDGTPRSYKAAGISAKRLLEIPSIRRELKAAERALAKRLGVTRERVAREHAAIAFFDPADVFAPDPSQKNAPAPKPWNQVPAAARKAISKIKIKRRRLAGGGDEVYEVEEIEYAFHPKDAALARLKEMAAEDAGESGGKKFTLIIEESTVAKPAPPGEQQ